MAAVWIQLDDLSASFSVAVVERRLGIKVVGGRCQAQFCTSSESRAIEELLALSVIGGHILITVSVLLMLVAFNDRVVFRSKQQFSAETA